jgi:hypothetical protein
MQRLKLSKLAKDMGKSLRVKNKTGVIISLARQNTRLKSPLRAQFIVGLSDSYAPDQSIIIVSPRVELVSLGALCQHTPAT